MVRKVYYSKKEILESIIDIHKKYGSCSYRLFDTHGICTCQTAEKITQEKFKSLKIQALGLSEIRNYRTEKEALDADIMEVYCNKGTNRFTKEYYLDHGNYSRKPIERIYGSWNKMLLEKKLPINCRINIPKEELIEDIHRLIDEYGTISATTIKKFSKFSVWKYQAEWGSIKNMYKELKIEEIAEENNKFKIAKSTIYRLEQILGEEALFEYTDDRFINEKTGFHLYIDAYFPVANLAFEYDGLQHFIATDMFGLEEEVIKRQELDKLKEKKIKEANMKFLRLTYKDSVTNVDLIKKLAKIL